jgi:hypothetical protein
MLFQRQLSLKLAIASLIVLLCACTPALNWRDVRLESADGSTLKASLPCKPDAATRKQQLAGIQVDLSMMGCVANEAMFTLSRIPLSNPLDAPKVLVAWQAAGVANARVKSAGAITISAVVSGASAWPPAVWQSIDGEVTQAHMMWFAKQTANGVTVYQAAMYGKQLSNDSNQGAVTTFFESLQLQ